MPSGDHVRRVGFVVLARARRSGLNAEDRLDADRRVLLDQQPPAQPTVGVIPCQVQNSAKPRATGRDVSVVAAIRGRRRGVDRRLTPDPPPVDPGPSTVKTVSNATFEWTISREADGSFAPGEVNYWSAGQSDSTVATYVPTNGHVTVLKKNASGTYVPHR